MIRIDVWKKKPCNYISLEHLEHAANHHGGSVRHPFHVGGRQIPQFVSQKPQINHCLRRLRHLQLTHKFVYIFSNVSHEVLGAKNIYEGPAITTVLKHIIFGSLLENMLLCSAYLGVDPVPLLGGHHVLQDLTDSLGHVVGHVVHSLHRGVREETVLSKQGFYSWFKPFTVYANLSWSQCSVTTGLA